MEDADPAANARTAPLATARSWWAVGPGQLLKPELLASGAITTRLQHVDHHLQACAHALHEVGLGHEIALPANIDAVSFYGAHRRRGQGDEEGPDEEPYRGVTWGPPAPARIAHVLGSVRLDSTTRISAWLLEPRAGRDIGRMVVAPPQRPVRHDPSMTDSTPPLHEEAPPDPADEPVSFGRELLGRLQRNDASGMAAELAYRFVLAVFPFGLFLAGLVAFGAVWLGVDNPTEEIIAGIGDNLPADLAGTVRGELETVIGTQRPGVMSIGAVLALWSATSGTMTAIKVMNRAYEVEETRSLIGRYALGIVLTVAGSIGIIAAFVTIVGGAVVTEELAEQLGATGAMWQAITLLRWPLVFVFLVLGTAVLYRVGPNMRPAWRTALIGGAVFALGWLVATLGFSLYVANVANYGATYGTLGGIIVLLIWLYITGLVLILGAEIVAMVTARTEPERLRERQDEISVDTAQRAVRVAGQRLTGAAKDGRS